MTPQQEKQQQKRALVARVQGVRQMVDNVARIAAIIPAEDVALLSETMQWYENTAWYLDPTAYKQAMDSGVLDKRQKLLAAFLQFHGVVREVWEEEKAEAEEERRRRLAELGARLGFEVQEGGPA